LIAFLAHVWKQTPPDIVQIEFTSMAQYARLAREFGALVVCTAHNVAFLAQLRRARQEQTPALRIRRLAGMLSLWQYELRALRYCDIIVALGEVDAAVLRRWLPRVPIVCVPSGVDLEEWTSYSSSPASDEVLFVGNYAHPPNVEGACWFVHNVWPQIQAARPSARLTLAGRAPPPAIQALVSNTIRVPGAVVDLRPLYKSASVVVAPIFWGSGVRIKLLEALASGRPVVTTALAAEGLGLAEGHSALFAEQPHEFAAAVLRLLNDSQLSAYIGAAGRAIVEQRYDWRHIGRLLAGMYEGARAGVSHKTR
jgi:glycosyltransferase involved in cell wall biosynthesis